MTKVRFRPEAWINDYAVEVDPQGETIFDAGNIPSSAQDDSCEIGRLRNHANALQWARDWTGPFAIEVLREPAPPDEEEGGRPIIGSG